MAAEHFDRDTVREFWKRSEELATALLSQSDSTGRFYIGAITAAAGWFATNASDKSLAAVLVLCLGVVGGGHVSWYQLRWFRVHRRVRFLAARLADLSGVAPDDRLYTSDDDHIHLLRTGQPISGALFSSFAVLAIATVYSVILALVSLKG